MSQEEVRVLTWPAVCPILLESVPRSVPINSGERKGEIYERDGGETGERQREGGR